MRAVTHALPCYTGDVSGACSALYELGGMVVIHDPSGCNSTYNTHDETRWYDQDSLVFISGLSERDAILGNDEKLVNEVVEAAQALNLAFIALAGSPVPYLTGTDFSAIARAVSERCGAPAFHVATNGMHDYVRGAGQAFAEVARHLVRDGDARRERALNVLGMTPLDFAAPGCADSLANVVREGGWELVSCWAMGSDLGSIERAGEAEVNLVVSASGLAAARVLHERFGTPYVVGLPVPGFRDEVFAALDCATRTGESEVACQRRIGDAASEVALVGEPVCMGSLAAALMLRRGIRARVICPVEADRSLTLGIARTRGEAELARTLAGVSHVVADPLFAPVVPRDATLHPLPHLAFSGRCCLADMVDPLTFDVCSVLCPEPREVTA